MKTANAFPAKIPKAAPKIPLVFTNKKTKIKEKTVIKALSQRVSTDLLFITLMYDQHDTIDTKTLFSIKTEIIIEASTNSTLTIFSIT